MKKLILFLIIFLGFSLRFYQLGKVPVSIYWDEAAFGVNARLITETGKDEYGQTLPLFFRSFDDYKLPGYAYLLVPVIKVFGLSEWSVRFPSALLGTLTILTLYLLVKALVKKERVALLAAFLLAISPWAIQFSRAGFEANAGLFFVVTGIWLFFNNKFTSVVSVALSLYFYRSLHIFAPLLVLVMFAKRIKYLFIFGFIAAPILYFSFFSSQSARISQVSIFTQPEKKVVYAQKFIAGYIEQLKPNFLYIYGDGNLRHSLVSFGLEYWWELPFLIAGIILAIKNFRKYGWLLLTWVLVAPIPAALALPVPHALRGLNIVPVLVIFSAFGLSKIKSGLFALLPVIFIYFYLNQYYFVWAKESASSWGDGYKQLVQTVKEKEPDYDKILVTGHYWQPYIYFKFYNDRLADKYMFGPTGWDKGGYTEELRGVNLKQYANDQNVLVALSPEEYAVDENQVIKIQSIYNNNAELVFILAKTK